MSKKSTDFFTLNDFDLDGKVVFLRVDINSPINPITNEITGDSRFWAHVETLKDLENSRVVLVGHQSRAGKDDFISLRGHALHMQRIIGREVKFIDALFGDSVRTAVLGMKKGDIIMLENSRFYTEEANLGTSDIETMEGTNLVRSLAPLFDYYIVDAFPAIHRSQTTLVGFRRIKPNIAGRLVEKEIRMLEKFSLGNEHPKVAILAGSKIDDSISVSRNFLENSTVDTIIAGGVVANAFLWAKGIDIGKRNEEFIMKNNGNYQELISVCKDLISRFNDKIVLPADVVLNPSGKRINVGEPVPEGELMADIGVETIVRYSEIIERAKAIFLNGPMGMYEIDQFSSGTREILESVAKSKVLTIAGGGHTLSALEKLNLLNKIDHASTGGGALISYLSGEPMPVLESLSESKKIFAGK